MTFKQETKTIPLIEDHLKYQFKQLQVIYLEFMKVYEDLVNFDQKLINITRKDYDKIKDDMYYKIYTVILK
jgi:homospermidine synthase